MSIQNTINVEAAVERFLGNGLCMARLSNGHKVVAYSSRRDRNEIAALRVGDNVRLEMSSFDMSKGCILYRKHDKRI